MKAMSNEKTAVQWLIDELMDEGVGIKKWIREYALELEERQKNVEWQEGNQWAYNNVEHSWEHGFKGNTIQEMQDWQKERILKRDIPNFGYELKHEGDE